MVDRWELRKNEASRGEQVWGGRKGLSSWHSVEGAAMRKKERIERKGEESVFMALSVVCLCPSGNLTLPNTHQAFARHLLNAGVKRPH